MFLTSFQNFSKFFTIILYYHNFFILFWLFYWPLVFFFLFLIRICYVIGKSYIIIKKRNSKTIHFIIIHNLNKNLFIHSYLIYIYQDFFLCLKSTNYLSNSEPFFLVVCIRVFIYCNYYQSNSCRLNLIMWTLTPVISVEKINKFIWIPII